MTAITNVESQGARVNPPSSAWKPSHTTPLKTYMGYNGGKQLRGEVIQPAVEVLSGDAYDGLNNFLDFSKKLILIKYGIAVIMTPIHLYNMIKTAINLNKVSPDKRIDIALATADNFRCLGESSVTVTGALKEFKVIAPAAAAWTGPFSIVLAGLSMASVTSNYRNCHRIRDLRKAMDKADFGERKEGRSTLNSLQAMITVLEEKQKKDEDFIDSTFDVEEDSLAEALHKREEKIKKQLDSTDIKEQNQGQELLEGTIKTLKGRVRKNFLSSAWSIVASVINMIGTALILACPPLPIGWILVGVGGATDLMRMLHNFIIQRRFKKALEIE